MLKNRLIIAGLMMCLILAAIPSVLSAAAADGQGTALASSSPTTAPAVISKNLPATTTAVYSNVATKYWLELKAYPSTNTKGLWLYVDKDWRYLAKPTSNIESSVQQAFANPDIFNVQVWYSGHNIVGLVVNTK